MTAAHDLETVRHRRGGVLAAVAVALAGCGAAEPVATDGSGGGRDGGVGVADGGSADAVAADPTARLFDPTRVIQVDLRMAPADWDALRKQSRDFKDTLVGAECLSRPFPSPFTWFPASVTVEGVTVGTALVRKKAFMGSLDDKKPSLKIDLDDVDKGANVFGADDLTLNNSKQDPSYLRQCLTYGVFRAAGLPAPRCNFARVTVNGADLGAYVHVERLDRAFLRRHFASDEGNLYEGTLSDFQDGWLATFDAKSSGAAADGSDLRAVASAVAVPDAQLEAALGRVIDLPAFYDFWAAEVLVSHWDGYVGNQNNFFVYADPSSRRFRFLPWGTDGTLSAKPDAPASVLATGVLAWRLYRHPPTRATYVARLRALLDGAWSEATLLAEIGRMARLLDGVADDRWGSRAVATAAVRDFVARRRAAIVAELGAGPPDWPHALRESFCFVERGRARGAFATTYGSNAEGMDVFAVGTGSLAVTLDGVPWAVGRVGANAGVDTDTPGRVAVGIATLLGDGGAGIVVISVEQDRLIAGAPIDLDLEAAAGYVVRLDLASGAFKIEGVLLGGQVTFERAGTTNGAAVTGRFDAPVYAWPF